MKVKQHAVTSPNRLPIFGWLKLPPDISQLQKQERSIERCNPCKSYLYSFGYLILKLVVYM